MAATPDIPKHRSFRRARAGVPDPQGRRHPISLSWLVLAEATGRQGLDQVTASAQADSSAAHPMFQGASFVRWSSSARASKIERVNLDEPHGTMQSIRHLGDEVASFEHAPNRNIGRGA